MKSWIINHEITAKQRMSIIILADSTSIPVYHRTRTGTNMARYNRLGYDGSDISGFLDTISDAWIEGSGMIPVTYDEAIKIMLKYEKVDY